MFDAETDKDEIRVRFGSGKTQTMPLEWASVMLTKLHAEDPQRFGKLLTWTVNEGTNGGR